LAIVIAKKVLKKIEDIIIHHLGPKLCYSFGRDKLNLLNIKNYNVNEGDSVIFCFGEIDCRSHIYRYENNILSAEEIIDNMIENYFLAIFENISQFKYIKVFVYNVVPPADITKIMEDKDEIDKHVYTKILHPNILKYPWQGNNEDRKRYHLYFNKKVEEYCNKYNFIFFNVYNKYTDENGFLNSKFSDQNVHITDPIYLKEFLNTHN